MKSIGGRGSWRDLFGARDGLGDGAAASLSDEAEAGGNRGTVLGFATARSFNPVEMFQQLSATISGTGSVSGSGSSGGAAAATLALEGDVAAGNPSGSGEGRATMPLTVPVFFDGGRLGPYTDQDFPEQGGAGITVAPTGDAVALEGNLWKRVALDSPFLITGGTILSVDLSLGEIVPEFVAIGFDGNEDPFDASTIFQLAGTQGKPAQFLTPTSPGVDLGGGVTRFELDLSAFEGEVIDSLVIVNDDDDAGNGFGSSVYANVQLFHEGELTGNLPPVVAFEAEEIRVETETSFGPMSPETFRPNFFDPEGEDLSLAFDAEDLPPGLALDADGALVGTPSAPGTFSVSVTAEDGVGQDATLSVPIVTIALEPDAVISIEAEDFTGLSSAASFFVQGIDGSSGGEVIRVKTDQSATVVTDLGAVGILPGVYDISADVFDETDGAATITLTIGGEVVASEVSFDSAGAFFNPGVARNGAASLGNLKRIPVATQVTVEAGDVLLLDGQADDELLRIDRFLFTVAEPHGTPTAPGEIALTPAAASVAENALGVGIGTLSAVDPDGDDGAIVFSVDPASPFTVVDGTTLSLKADAALDFEGSGGSVTVSVTATDEAGESAVGQVAVAIEDVNEAPVLPNGASLEDVTLATVSGGTMDLSVLGATDPDAGDVVTYGATSPDGGALPDGFGVVGSQLTVAPGLPGGEYTISVFATDGDLTTDTVPLTVTLDPSGEDTTADAGGDLTLIAPAEVKADLVGDVALRLTGVDGDITGFALSIDDGATFSPLTVTPDGQDLVASADLTGFDVGDEVDLVLRVIDGVGNTATADASVTIDDARIPFNSVFQAESFFIVEDKDLDIERRTSANPEPTGPNDPRGPDGLWDGFRGNGYLDLGNDTTDIVGFSVSAPESDTYTLEIRYANGGSADRPLTVLVAGQEIAVLPMASTGEWDDWATVSIDVPLLPGANQIWLRNAAGNGPNLDEVTVTNGVAPPPPDRLDTVIKVNFEPEAGMAGAPDPYQTPDGFEADTGAAFGDRGNGFSYGWVDVINGTTAVDAPEALAPGAIAYRTTADGASNLMRTVASFQFPGGAGPEVNERLWEIALENGHYEITVSVGDASGALGGSYFLNAEDTRIGDPFSPFDDTGLGLPTGGFRSDIVTGSVEVTDGALTLDGFGSDNLEIQWLEIRSMPDLTPLDDRPAPLDYARFQDPVVVAGVGQDRVEVSIAFEGGTPPTGAAPDGDISIGLQVVSGRDAGDLGRAGISLESLVDGSIRLIETVTGREVLYNANTSGGNDTLTITPSAPLAPNTSYTLMIDGALDLGENDGSGVLREFQTHTTTFLTGPEREVEPTEVAFTQSIELNGAADGLFGAGSITLSPDGRYLYATTLNGSIERFRIDSTDGSLIEGSRETLNLTNDPGYFQNPEAPALNTNGFVVGPGRAIIGIAFDPNDPSVLWVTDNFPVPLTGRNPEVPEFSGRLSKITLDGTSGVTDVVIDQQGNTIPVPAFNAWAEAYVTGLPRSAGDHLTNSIAFRPNPDFDPEDPASGPSHHILLSQGANTAIGGNDPGWGSRPERLLSAAVLKIDPSHDVSGGPVDVSTEPLPTDGQNRRFTTTPDPDARVFDDVVDNFAILRDGETVYLGRVQIPDGTYEGEDAALNGKWLHFDENGVASVRETDEPSSALVRAFYDPYADGVPVTIFATGVRNAYDIVIGTDGVAYLPSNGTAAGGRTPDDPATPFNEQIDNVSTQDDYLFVLSEGGYYGSPNPVRGEYIAYAGNLIEGAVAGSLEVEAEGSRNGYPLGTAPEKNYDALNAFSLSESRSPNGALQYKSSVFGASLQNFLLIAEYSQGNDIIAIPIDEEGRPDVAGRFVLTDPSGRKLSWTDPLDIVEGPKGVLYVSTLDRSSGESQIIRLTPQPGDVIEDTTADQGDDLALIPVDFTDLAAVLFRIDGLDEDIVEVSVTFDDGATTRIVEPDAQGRFSADLTDTTGDVVGRLTVTDAVGNSATTETVFTPVSQPGGLVTLATIEAEDDDPADGRFAVATGSGIETRDADNREKDPSDPAYNSDSFSVGLRPGAFGIDGNTDYFDGIPGGYVDFGSNNDNSLRFTFSVSEENAGIGTLRFRFANGSDSDRPLAVTANGVSAGTIDFDPTGNSGDGWTRWQTAEVLVTLIEGENVVTLDSIANTGPNIDRLEVLVAGDGSGPIIPNDGIEIVGGVEFIVYEAENAAIDGLDILGDPRNQRGEEYLAFGGSGEEAVTFTVLADVAGEYTGDFLYALAGSKAPRPLTLTVNNVSHGDLPFLPNSTTTENIWGPQGFSVDLVAGLNSITLSAPDGIGPNLDYLRLSSEPMPPFAPFFVDIVEDGRIEVEAADNSVRVLDDSAVEIFFSVETSGAYELAVAANADAPDGETLDVLLNGVALGTIDYPAEGTAGEVGIDTALEAGVDYTLRLVSSAPGAADLDYLDVTAAVGNPDADIFVSAVEPAFFSGRLAFNFIQNTDVAFKEDGTVRLENRGTADLVIEEAVLTGPFVFDVPGILDAVTLAPGEILDVGVTFDNAAYTPTGQDTTSNIFGGQLTLRTNDQEDPELSVDLVGFWQSVDEHGQEPNINEVWRVFGFGNEVAGLSLAGGGEESVLSNNDVFATTPATEAAGEILSPYFRVADGVDAVRVTQIAAFHGPGNATFGIHAPGNNGDAFDDRFWGHGNNQNQSILPRRSGDGGDGGIAATGTFSTVTFTAEDIPPEWDDVFGFEVGNLSSDPTLNKAGPILVGTDGTRYERIGDSNDARGPDGTVYDVDDLDLVQQGHILKVFEAKDAVGNIIPDTYLLIQDYTGINYDYNDNMFVVEGVTAAGFGDQNVSIVGLDASAADDRLVFSRLDRPNTGTQEFRDEASFEIVNEGSSDLTVTGLTLGGDDPEVFEIVNGPGAGTVLAPDDRITVEVRYTGVDPTNDNRAVLHEGLLEVGTDDPDTPVASIALAGLAQFQSQGNEEPSVEEIVEAFGYTTDMAQADLRNGGVVETVGDEVLMPYMQALDPTAPIVVTSIAVYQGPNVSRLNIHGVDGEPVTELLSNDDQQFQTVLADNWAPGVGNAGPAVASFLREDPFGLSLLTDGRPTFASWTDPEANERDPFFGNRVDDGEGHYMRFFEARDVNGEIIEGRFIGLQDYPGGGNFDYNDLMFVIDNVAPYDLTLVEDADQNGINDTLETDSDADGTLDFFDADDGQSGGGGGGGGGGSLPAIAQTAVVGDDAEAGEDGGLGAPAPIDDPL